MKNTLRYKYVFLVKKSAKHIVKNEANTWEHEKKRGTPHI